MKVKYCESFPQKVETSNVGIIIFGGLIIRSHEKLSPNIRPIMYPAFGQCNWQNQFHEIQIWVNFFSSLNTNLNKLQSELASFSNGGSRTWTSALRGLVLAGGWSGIRAMVQR